MYNISADKKSQAGIVGKWLNAQEETPEQILEKHRQKMREDLHERKATAAVEEDEEDEVVIKIERK